MVSVRIYIIAFISILVVQAKAAIIQVDSVPKKMHISILLPFYTSKYNPDSELILNTSFPDELKMGTEYYYGVKIALDSIKKAGYDVVVHIFDTGDDSLKTKKILHTPFLNNSDVILVASNESGDKYPILAMVEHFSRRSHIPVFEVSHTNNFIPIKPDSTFYILNATWQTHAHTLSAFLMHKTHPLKWCIITTPDKDSDNVKLFVKTCKDFDIDNDTVAYRKDSLFNSITTKLSLTDTNVIVIPFTTDEVVRSVLQDLQNIPKEYSYIIIGMPEWRWFKYNSQGFMLPANVYLTTTTWHVKSSPLYKKLDNDFHKRTNRALTDNVILGYEQTLWLSNLYFNHSDSLNEQITATTYNGLANKYRMLKVVDEYFNYLYTENANVFIIKPYYTGFKKVK